MVLVQLYSMTPSLTPCDPSPQLYQPLNIFIALVGVEVWKDEDQVEISKDGDKTLTNFLNYRKVRLIRDHPNDNAQLLT